MKTLTSQLGLWSASICLAGFISWIICFAGILLTNPLFTWSSLDAFVKYSLTYNQAFKYLAQAAMLVFALSFVVMVLSAGNLVSGEKQLLARISSAFAVVFAACTSIHYFIQLSVVPLSIGHQQTEGIEQFVQANPYSAIAGINILGWTLFLSLSCIFLAMVYSGHGIEIKLRTSLLSNGAICLTGGISYILDWKVLVFLTLNLGMGGALMLVLVLYILYFRKAGSGTTLVSAELS
jgi:hypothetical protein